MKPHSPKHETPPCDAVRKATVAGKFYPRTAQTLRRTVTELLAKASSAPLPKDVIALVSPHAGYIYSGGVAAHAYKLLQVYKPEIVAVVAPSHFERFPFISLFNGRAYETPLGEVRVAQALVNELTQRHELFQCSWLGHYDRGRTEHALEVQLPFLQTVLPECELLPIVMGEHSWEMCEVLGKNLAALAAARRLLLIASSDLSHYHNAEEAQQLDEHCINLLRARKPRELFEAFERHDCEACGVGPIIATMLCAEQLRSERGEILSYDHSGTVSGDRDCVVGYVAAGFMRKV